MTYQCPKCGKYGIEWDARAKVLLCYYNTCNHVIRIKNQKTEPNSKVILAAIRKNKGEMMQNLRHKNKPKSNFIKFCEKASKIVKTWPK